MKVVFIDSVHPILQERLEAKGFECLDVSEMDDAACRQEMKSAQGLVVRSRFRLDENSLNACTQLSFIARSGAGMENIDVDYCLKRNIQLFNAPEGNRNAVGEHALGMLLAIMNHLHTADRDIRQGHWEREKNRGEELDGKTIGIIGFGNNGSAFAQKLRGFDVTVLVYDKYKSGFGTETVHEVSLEKLYQNADVISFHIPQNEETTYFADEHFFSSVQKPFYLLNLSRGKIVKTEALVKALRSGKVKGACLDVLEYEKSSFEHFFDQETPENLTYLLQSDRVLLSPHVGGWTQESYFKLSDVLADKILAHY